MKSNIALVITLVLLLAVGLTACTRNLPPPESATSPTSEGPSAPTDDIGQILALNLTQTAQALMPQVTPEVPGEITEMPEGSEVPLEGVTETVVVETPTATLPPIDVPTVAVPAEYTLKGGEYPYCIARRFDVDPGALLRLNGLSSASTYYAGMNLKIPQSGSFPGGRSLRDHPTIYTVTSGDTIYKIACIFGDVAPEQIIAANNLEKPYQVKAGQELRIP
jgi:LysM repeat protein